MTEATMQQISHIYIFRSESIDIITSEANNPQAEAKQFHCLSCAKYRRLGKVQSQAYMCATALNIKRLVAFIFSIFLVWLSQFIKHQISWLHKNISNLRVFS